MKRFLVLAVLTLMAVSALSGTSSGVFQAPRVLFEDRFNNDKSGWKKDRTWSYSDDDQYRMFLRNPNTISFSEAPETSLSSRSQYCVEVDIKLLLGSALAEDGFVGFYIGGEFVNRNNFPNATWFGIDSFKRFLIRTTEDTGRIIQLGTVRTINNAFDDVNIFHTLRLEVDAPTVGAYLDGVLLATVSVEAVGDMGFMAFSFDDPNLNARFDNITVWDVCPEDN